MISVLIIDDDVELCAMLRDYLEPNGIQLSIMHHGVSGSELLRREDFALLILDVMLPEVDGFDVLRSLRNWSDIGVLLLSARGENIDRVVGLEIGADDYLAKPFNPRELLLRMRAILRRGNVHLPVEMRKMQAQRLFVDGVVIDCNSRTVYCDDRRLDLTGVEFELMCAFLEEPGKVLPRENLMVRVFDREFHPEDRSLDMCVSRLRRKLDGVNTANSRIKTIRSAGYLFSARGKYLDSNAFDPFHKAVEGTLG